MQDADGDGIATWAEYSAGTNPTNGESFLGFDLIVPEADGTGIVVRWESVDGKFYRVERGTNLADNPRFMTLVETNILGVAPLNTVTDRTVSGDGPWFYRIKLE